MTTELKQVLLPLGIGLMAVGIIFGISHDPFFFGISGIGLIMIILSTIKTKKGA